jgi:hypothetical protein
MQTSLLKLDDSERELLTNLEQTIDAGKKKFIEVGNALLIVSRQKLWREGYESFEAYCQNRHGFKKSQAYRLIEASSIATELSPIGENLNEAQCRVLAEVPKNERPAVLEKAQKIAAEENRPLRAKDIETAAPIKPTAPVVKESLTVETAPVDSMLIRLEEMMSEAEAFDLKDSKRLRLQLDLCMRKTQKRIAQLEAEQLKAA